MLKSKSNSQELIKKSVTLTDSIAELDAIIEKIYVISSDVFENYIEKMNFKTEKGKLTAEYDFNIIKVMIDVMQSYIARASRISQNLPELSDNILEEIKEELQYNN